MRLVFAGTPGFSVPALDALVEAGHVVAAVYTQPDRPAGRGRRVLPSPVKQRALELGIPVEQPGSLKSAEAQARLREHAPEVMIVVAYGLLLPQAVLDIPSRGCLNIHASLLPRWRGAAPIQRAIEAGDSESGVAIMQMERGLDTGPVLLEKPIPVGARDTAGELHDRLARLGAEAIVEALAQLDELAPQAQDDACASYARKLEKHEACIDWREDAVVIERRVRAFNPWPVAFTSMNGAPLRIWRAEAIEGRGEPGTVLAAGNGGIDVAAGRGALRILELQPAGKRQLSAAEFLNGHPLAIGTRLGD